MQIPMALHPIRRESAPGSAAQAVRELRPAAHHELRVDALAHRGDGVDREPEFARDRGATLASATVRSRVESEGMPVPATSEQAVSISARGASTSWGSGSVPCLHGCTSIKT
jgi:hypothetical protein